MGSAQCGRALSLARVVLSRSALGAEGLNTLHCIHTASAPYEAFLKRVLQEMGDLNASSKNFFSKDALAERSKGTLLILHLQPQLAVSFVLSAGNVFSL